MVDQGAQRKTNKAGHLLGALECVLFAAPDPVPLGRLVEVLGCGREVVEDTIRELDRALEGHGLQVVHLAGGYALATRPEYAEYVNRLREPPRERLSEAALEVLAIIAYRQPVTKPEIDALRGVDSAGPLHTLLEKRLVAVRGRKQAPGRPLLFVTTEQFLAAFGLQDLSGLPDAPSIFPERGLQLSLEANDRGAHQ
jgi:segregation and condensation protein B